MKAGRDYKKFLFSCKDGAEFVLCEICRFNKHGDCLRSGSAADSPSEMYFDICKKFEAPISPINPYTFKKLMERMRDASVNEPSCVEDSRDAKRYNMEYLMCMVLEQLGYGEGAKIFLDCSFELPF